MSFSGRAGLPGHTAPPLTRRHHKLFVGDNVAIWRSSAHDSEPSQSVGRGLKCDCMYESISAWTAAGSVITFPEDSCKECGRNPVALVEVLLASFEVILTPRILRSACRFDAAYFTRAPRHLIRHVSQSLCDHWSPASVGSERSKGRRSSAI
eukprot:scaffold739_cov166-Pinguiococcus_pyrenoidosus.AAC.3